MEEGREALAKEVVRGLREHLGNTMSQIMKFVLRLQEQRLIAGKNVDEPRFVSILVTGDGDVLYDLMEYMFSCYDEELWEKFSTFLEDYSRSSKCGYLLAIVTKIREYTGKPQQSTNALPESLPSKITPGSTAEVSQQRATNSSKTAGVKRDQLEQGTPIPHHDQDMPSTSAPKKAKHEEGGVECHIYWSGLHEFQWKYCAVAKDPKTGVTAKGDYKLSEDGAKKHAMKNLAIALQDHGIADSVDYTPPASSQVEPDQSSSPPEQLKSEPGIQHKGISKPDTVAVVEPTVVPPAKKPNFEERNIDCHVYKSNIHNWEWKHSAIATDVATGISVKAQNYKAKSEAMKHARENLRAALKSRGIISDYADIKAEADVETDDQFQKKFIAAAIEQGGSVEVEIVKIVTLGPPEAGKTQLKRALTGNMEESTESTTVSTGAEVIMERYIDGGVKWEPMGKTELRSALCKTVNESQYEAKSQKSGTQISSAVHDTPGEPNAIAPQEILMPTTEGGSDTYGRLKVLKSDFDLLQKKVLANFTRSQGTRHLSKVRIIHFIDSGGQFIDLHPILSTSRAVYLIVYNSAEGLDVQPEFTYRRPGDSPTKQRRTIPNPKLRNKDLIKLSLLTLDHCKAKFSRMEDKARKSLDMSLATESSTQLPTVIVGSRMNSCHHQTNESDSKIIQDHCCHIPMYRDNIIGKVHFVDSMEPLKGIKELHDTLRKIDCRFYINRFPLKWFYCQLVFWSAEDLKFSVLTYSDLQALCRGFVSGDEEFRALLTTFHLLGIFSCPVLDLPDHEVDQESLSLSPVFTNPNVLFKQVTALLEVSFLNPSEDLKNGHAISKLQKSGIIEQESLTLLGIPDTIGSFHGFHSYLLKYLVKWGLAAELKESSYFSGSDQLLHKKLFIPSILLPREECTFAPPPGFVALPSFTLTIMKIKEEEEEPEDYCIPQGLFPHFIVNIMNCHKEGYCIKIAYKTEIRCRDVLAITKKADKGTKLPYTIYVVDNIDHISVHITLARKGGDSTSCHSDCCTIVNDLKASMEKAYSHLFGDEGTSSVIIGCKCTCDEEKSCHLAQLDCHSQVLRCLLPDREHDVEIEFCDTLKRIFPAHGSRKGSPPGPSTSKSSTKKKFTMYSDDGELPHCQGTTNETSSSNSAHPHLGLGLIPSDIGLSQVVSKIGIKYEEVAVLLGIPRTHASMQSGSLKGLDTLTYWRDGKSGSDFPTTWKFLLKKVEEVCGSGVTKDIEKALLSNRTWCDNR